MPRSFSRAQRVLFVNIGWSERYDNTERPRGGHAWLNEPSGDAKHGSAEELLFKRRCGPIGAGKVAKGPSLDVVFVAREPPAGAHRVVALFRRCKLYQTETDAKDYPLHWRVSSDCVVLYARKRVKVKWPGRMSMRRWAKGGARNWPELLRAYNQLTR